VIFEKFLLKRLKNAKSFTFYFQFALLYYKKCKVSFLLKFRLIPEKYLREMFPAGVNLFVAKEEILVKILLYTLFVIVSFLGKRSVPSGTLPLSIER